MPRRAPMMDVHQVFQEFADGTSMHGVPRIINARSVTARIFWSIICLGAFGMFFWQCGILLQRYYSYPKKVNVEIIQRPVPFPAVSVCNVDHIDMLYVAQLNSFFEESSMSEMNGTTPAPANVTTRLQKDEEISRFSKHYKELMERTTQFLLVYQSLYGEQALKNTLEAVSRLGLVANLDQSVISNAGVKREDFIVSCRFMDETCNTTDNFFRRIYDPYYFNCFTFRPEIILPSRMSRLQGIEYGLSLLLFMGSAGQLQKPKQQNQALFPGMEESDSALAAGKGARVVIHSTGTKPFPTAEGYDIPPGFSVTIGVKAKENVRIDIPHGNCTPETESDKEKEFKYTLISCQYDCIQHKIMEVCHCIDSRISIPSDRKDLPYCFQLPNLDPLCSSIILSDSAEAAANYYSSEGSEQYSAEESEYPEYSDYSDYPDYHGYPEFPMESNMTPAEKDKLLKGCNTVAEKWHKTMQCRKMVYDNMTMRDAEAMDSCNCFPPCNDIEYDATYSLSTMPEEAEEHTAFYVLIEPFLESLSPAKRHILAERYGGEEKIKKGIMRHISRLNVHIADSNIMKTTEAPDYEAIRLVSDIGGQLGLWIGISVMTLFEVLQLVADVFRFLTAKGRYMGEKNKADDKAVINKRIRPYGNGQRYPQANAEIEYPCEFEKLTTV